MSSKKGNRRTRRAVASVSQGKKISEEALAELQELKEEADLANQEFQVALARAFRSTKSPIQDSIVCLRDRCGRVRPKLPENMDPGCSCVLSANR
jgi:capsule polysaccharide export protein KpsE/RkpR